MKKIYFLTILTITFLSDTVAQNVFLEWVKKDTTAGVIDAEAYDLSIDDEENIVITGSTVISSGMDQIVTIKYAPNGDLKWRKVNEYAGNFPYRNVGSKVLHDKDGNVLVAGGARTEDPIIVKFSKEGDQLWKKTTNDLGIYGYGWAKDMDIYSDGSAAIYSRMDLHNGLGPAFHLMKINASGGLLWEKLFITSSVHDYPTAMAIDKNENIYITGSSYHFYGTGTYDFLTSKFTPGGSRQWISYFNHTATQKDHPIDIAVNDSAFQFITGTSEIAGQTDFSTIMQNEYGTRLWAETYAGSGNGNDSAFSVTTDHMGNAVITGVSYESVNGTTIPAMTTIKYDKAGGQVWLHREYGSEGSGAGGKTVVTDASGNVYVAGFQNTASSTDILVVKYSPAGQRLWEYIHNGSFDGADNTNILKVKNGKIYIGGYETVQGNIKNYLLLKLNEDNIPSAANVMENPEIRIYPNPGSDRIVIDFSEVIGNGRMAFFDMAGRVLYWQEIKGNKNPIDISNLPAGLYLVEIQINGSSFKKKFIKH